MGAFAIIARHRTSGKDSPVLPFGGASGSTAKSDTHADTSISLDAGSSKDAKSGLLAGIALKARQAWKVQPSTPRKLEHQRISVQDRNDGTASSPPLRRCISTPGVANASNPRHVIDASSTQPSQACKLTPPSPSRASPGVATVASSPLPPSRGVAGASAGDDPLLDALASVSEAAANTACALLSARQQHEEVLQRQREEFQLLMEAMRLRSLQRDGAATTSPGGLSNGGSTIGATMAFRTPAPSSPPTAPTSATQQAHTPTAKSPGSRPAALTVPLFSHRSSLSDTPTRVTCTTQTFRGVVFSMPLGCRIQAGEQPGEVFVAGPQVHVALDFREEGRNVVLVSSNCVCTVKRMDGRTVVSVVAPLTGSRPRSS